MAIVAETDACALSRKERCFLCRDTGENEKINIDDLASLK